MNFQKIIKLFLLSLLFTQFFSQTLIAQVTVSGSTAQDGSYANLSTAFSAINGNSQTENTIAIALSESFTETTSAVLNSKDWTSLIIYPTVTGVVVSGTMDSPLIDLNEADNVTIDGRVGASGSDVDLTIVNYSTASTTGTSTIRLINGAWDNIIKYCTIKGSETSLYSGIIIITTDAVLSFGNDNNIIEYNNITSSSDANRPCNAIYSVGTSGRKNEGTIIRYNNFYDFLSPSLSSNGIYLGANTSDHTIIGNSFYETTTFAPTSDVSFTLLHIDYDYALNVIITNNYFGGSAASCGGSAWTKSATANNEFKAIDYLGQYTGSIAGTISNNTIKNINWSNSSSATWTALYVDRGIIDMENNIIGSVTGNNSIVFNCGSGNSSFYGYWIENGSTIDFENNSIGSITTSTTSSVNSNSIYAICLGVYVGITASNNIIGSTETSNSIFASSASTGSDQFVYGIYDNGKISQLQGNIISNLTNASTRSSTSSLGVTIGIYTYSGINSREISGNTICNLSNSNANNKFGYNSSVVGIATSGSVVKNIYNNTIYNLSNDNPSFTGSVIGIAQYGHYNADNSIYKNFIHSLSTNTAATSAKVCGINLLYGDNNVYNNVISLGGDFPAKIYGIYDPGNPSNSNSNIYFNSIYLFGAPSSGSLDTYCLYSNANTNYRKIENNIFFNARSNAGATGSNYAAYLNYSSNLRITLDYNDYFIDGTGGVMAHAGSDKSTLPLLTGTDANSYNQDPSFVQEESNLAVDYKIISDIDGAPISGITDDYGDDIRDVTTPTVGAWENIFDLPVEIISFSAECYGNSSLIKWCTASELNNDYFEIEKSYDGLNWESFAIINGHGNSNRIIKYQTEDLNSRESIYYRLKQNDFNGDNDLSKVIYLESCDKNYANFDIYPNPSNGVVNFSYSGNIDKIVSVEIYNSMGQLVLIKKLLTSDLDLSDLQNGVYYIKLNLGKEYLTRKIVLDK